MLTLILIQYLVNVRIFHSIKERGLIPYVEQDKVILMGLELEIVLGGTLSLFSAKLIKWF